MMHVSTWHSENTARLGDLIDAGESASAAAAALRCSRNSVIGRARRLGWRFGVPRPPEQRVAPFRVLPASAIAQRPARPPRATVAAEDRLVTVSCRFDQETHAEIVARAKTGKVSRIAVIRELIEWGLEASAGSS